MWGTGHFGKLQWLSLGKPKGNRRCYWHLEMSNSLLGLPRASWELGSALGFCLLDAGVSFLLSV